MCPDCVNIALIQREFYGWNNFVNFTEPDANITTLYRTQTVTQSIYWEPDGVGTGFETWFWTRIYSFPEDGWPLRFQLVTHLGTAIDYTMKMLCEYEVDSPIPILLDNLPGGYATLVEMIGTGFTSWSIYTHPDPTSTLWFEQWENSTEGTPGYVKVVFQMENSNEYTEANWISKLNSDMDALIVDEWGESLDSITQECDRNRTNSFIKSDTCPTITRCGQLTPSDCFGPYGYGDAYDQIPWDEIITSCCFRRDCVNSVAQADGQCGERAVAWMTRNHYNFYPSWTLYWLDEDDVEHYEVWNFFHVLMDKMSSIWNVDEMGCTYKQDIVWDTDGYIIGDPECVDEAPLDAGKQVFQVNEWSYLYKSPDSTNLTIPVDCCP